MSNVSCGPISVPTQDFSLWEYAAFCYSSSARMSKAKGEARPRYMVEINLHNQSGGRRDVQIKTTFAFLQ